MEGDIMSKSRKPTDLDAGMEPERLPKDTDTAWPAVHPAVEDALVRAEQLLVELEARCAAGGSATLDDIRACLKALRGE